MSKRQRAALAAAGEQITRGVTTPVIDAAPQVIESLRHRGFLDDSGALTRRGVVEAISQCCAARLEARESWCYRCQVDEPWRCKGRDARGRSCSHPDHETEAGAA